MPSGAAAVAIDLFKDLQRDAAAHQSPDHLRDADVVLKELTQAILGGGWSQLCPTHGPVKDLARIADVDLAEFHHGDAGFVRGLRASSEFVRGEPLLVVPKQQQLDPKEAVGARFETLSGDKARLAFMLAERKNQVLYHPSAHVAPPEQYWTAYFQSLPSLQEYRAQGLPLLATDDELHQIENLPHIDAIAKHALTQRKRILHDLQHYNAARGIRGKMSWKDALWSSAVTSTRLFDCGKKGGVRLAPSMDFINDQGTDWSNAKWTCNPDTGDLVVSANSRIRRNKELTMSYVHGRPSASALFSRYGWLDHLPHERKWADSECSRIRTLDLNHKSSPFFRALGRFVEMSCPKTLPTETPPAIPLVAENHPAKQPTKLPQTQPIVEADAAMKMSGPGGQGTWQQRQAEHAGFL